MTYFASRTVDVGKRCQWELARIDGMELTADAQAEFEGEFEEELGVFFG